MASPQLENGHTEIANELLEAIIKTPMSDYEHRIFWLIIRKTYGFKKKLDWISQTQIVKDTEINKQNVCRTIKKLLVKNMIIKDGKHLSIQKDYEQWKLSKQITNKSNLNRLQNKQKLSKQITKVINIDNESNLNSGIQKKLLQKKDIYNVEHYSEIINYLNEKADTKYKNTTEKTIDLIKARFNEGFTIEDFKTVIDKKIKGWTGTEWEKFIRPVTLFGTKFESYLNEKITKKDKDNDYFRA